MWVNEHGPRRARFENHLSKEHFQTNTRTLCSLISATVSPFYEAFASCRAHCSRARGGADLDLPQLRPPAHPSASRRPACPSTTSPTLRLHRVPRYESIGVLTRRPPRPPF